MLNPLSRIRIVLLSTTHPGNIGSAARAMKTMGLSQLALVTPRIFPSDEATALAAGADDVLLQAHLYETFEAAIADCYLVLGCTPRARSVAMPEVTPRLAAEQAYTVAEKNGVAIVFGTEASGLTNKQIQSCHRAVNIPANPEYDSLNLAQAVQVMCYELRMAALSCDTEKRNAQVRINESVSMGQMEGFFQHLEQTLDDIDFLKGRPSKTLMHRLRRLFLRADLTPQEVLLLRGIFNDARRCAALAGVAKTSELL
jgi:tRNA (cytidine32/uridine32-2'-O)-methyltransferase